MVIDRIDGVNRRIYLHSDTVSAGLTSFESFYREYRTMRETVPELQYFAPFLTAEGNVPLGRGKFTPRYIKLLQGCRIVPYNTTHTLLVTFQVITDDEKNGIECFDRLPLSLTSRVDIDYDYKGFETVQVATGSAMTTEEHNKLMSIPAVTLRADEREALMRVDAALHGIEAAVGELQSGRLTVDEFKRVLLNRVNTIQDGRISSYTAGESTVVDVQYDEDGIPVSETVRDDN